MPVNHLHVDLDARRQRADARWTALTAQVPHLARALMLQRRTVGTQFDLLQALAPLVAEATVPSETSVLDHLADGLPVLRANISPLPVDVPTPVMADLGAAITIATGYAAATRVAEALVSGVIVPERLLALVSHRDQDGVRQLATDHALVVDMLWLLGDLVVAPIVHLQQRAALREGEPDCAVRAPRSNAGTRATARPAGRGRRWPRSSSGNACCAAHSARARGARPWTSAPSVTSVARPSIVPDRQQPGRRLELCRTCGGFLKTLDVELVPPFPMVATEDLASSDLDQAALLHGFKRLPLKRI